MPITAIPRPGGRSLLDVTGDDDFQIIYLEQGQDIRTSAATGFIHQVQALFPFEDDNSALIRSAVRSLVLADGDDTATVSGRNGFVTSVLLGGGDDVLTVRNGATVVFASLEGGDNRVSVTSARIGTVNGDGGGTQLEVGRNGVVETVALGDGVNAVTLTDTGRIGLLRMAGSSNSVDADGGFVETVHVTSGAAQLDFGAAGVLQVLMTGQGAASTVSAQGWVGSLLAIRDTAVTVQLGRDGAGSVQVQGSGDHRITTGNGRVESIRSSVGDDRVTIGRGGTESLWTGQGDDIVILRGASGQVRTGAGNDSVTLRAPVDSVVLGEGDDVFVGSTGIDIVRGGIGADRLRGGRGDDVLYGGDDADTFVFAARDGRDVIMDFDIGFDRIAFDGGPRGLGGLTFTDAGDGTLIDYGSGTILVMHVAAADLRPLIDF